MTVLIPDSEGSNVVRKHANQEYATIVLRSPHAKDIGAGVRDIDGLVRLAGSRLDVIDGPLF